MTRPVVGIDPSLTATGIAWPDGTTTVHKWPGTGTDRLCNVEDTIHNWIDQWKFGMHAHGPLVMLEGYAHGRANQAHQMGELGGIIRVTLRNHGIQFVVVPPSSLKKYATGKGNANKDLVRDAARDRLGPLEPGITSDECDALWLRQIGLRLLDDPTAIAVPKTHLAALDKLTTRNP